MARYIDNAKVVPRQFQMSEAEVDGDAALFFLRQPVGVMPCERGDQRAFAVINMTGRGQDGMTDGHQWNVLPGFIFPAGV